jgi:hypothetical protein
VKRPPRANRSLTQKEIFNENSQNFKAKYEDIPLKRPPKYRAPKPKAAIVPQSQSSTTTESNDQKTRMSKLTEEYLSKTKKDIHAFNRMFTDYSYPISAQFD